MPKDYMKMAQSAGAPTEEISPEELQITDEDYEEMGLPGGEGPEAMKERIMTLLEQMGVLEGVDQSELQELTSLVDQLVADLEAENFEAVEQNPIMQLLSGVFEEMGVGEQAPGPGPEGML